MNVYANFRVFDHSLFIIRYLSLHLFRHLIFFSFRTLVIRVPTAKITQLVSLDLHSRDIDACVLLDSGENVLKRVEVLVNTWNDVCVRFCLISMLVWQMSFSWWKWRKFFTLYNVLNLSKRIFLTIVRFSFCFGLVCLLVCCFVVCLIK